MNDLQDIPFGFLDKTIRIGQDLLTNFKVHLVQFLVDNSNVFAWKLANMLGIDELIITHKTGHYGEGLASPANQMHSPWSYVVGNLGGGPETQRRQLHPTSSVPRVDLQHGHGLES